MEHPRPAPDHEYVFTLVGRCLRCQRTQEEHVKLLDEPDPMTECPVDHASLTTALFLPSTGTGWEWLRCPICSVMVEGHFPPIGPQGPAYGPGRGEWIARKLDRLKAWAGWTDFLGGR